jgi:hypothetical protein
MFFSWNDVRSVNSVNYSLHTTLSYNSSFYRSTRINKFIVSNQQEDDINNLLAELSGFSVPTPNATTAITDNAPLKEEDLQQYVLNKTKALIEAGLGAVQDLTPSVVAGSDSREIDALSKLMASTAQSIDTLQKIALINKKAEQDEKLEKIKIEGKKEIAKLQQGPQHVTNANILIASREEIMKKLFTSSNEIDIQ